MRKRARQAMAPSAVAVLTALTVVGLPALASRAQPPAPPRPAAVATARAGAPLGFDTIGVRRGSLNGLRGSLAATGGNVTYTESAAGWLPVTGDLDGDGTDSVSYFFNGTWLLSNAPRGPYTRVQFGRAGDRPVLGDWNGDGRDEIGVFRNGLWGLKTSASTLRQFAYGGRGDVPVVGDFNGDGRSDVSVRRGAAFYQRSSATPGAPTRVITYGIASDNPVAGDWNHDGLDEVGVFRNGLWSFRMPDGATQATSYGGRGDVPFVLRVATLAPGLTHGVLRRDESVVQVAALQLSASSTPDPVLASNGLGHLERTSAMAARTNAVLAVNGDFFAPSGRPIHAYASDGALLQGAPNNVPTGLGLTRDGATARANSAPVTVSFTPAGAAPMLAQRYNRGAPVGNELAAFTTDAAQLETLPVFGCFAQLLPSGDRYASSVGVERAMTVAAVGCDGTASTAPAGGVLLVGSELGTGGTFVQSLQPGQAVTMNQFLGFPDAVGLIGANEVLVSGGLINDAPLDVPGDYAQGRQPRTAVGVTPDNRLVIVEVDGRLPGWSAGMTLRQLATTMRDLGVVEAVNLDGGGSSTFVLNGLVINRPSDGYERAVAGGLVVLRGPDPSQAALRQGPLQPLPPPVVPGPTAAPPPTAAVRALSRRQQAVVQQAGSAESGAVTRDGLAAAQDPGSTGGFAESQRLAGNPLDPVLTLAVDLYEAQ